MNKCKLCLIKDATKTNSHILPHSLIKTATNKDGSKARDYELTFSFSSSEFVDTFLGKSLTLDTIKEVKGRELSEDELEAKNPFAEDYIFCPQCEKNLGVIEGYYAQEVLDKLRKGSYPKGHVDKYKNEIAFFNKVNLEIVLLLVYSIFFRCSITSYHGFKLGALEDKLRKLLDDFLDDSIPKIEAKLKGKKKFTYYPMLNTFFKKDDGEDTTKNFVTIQHSRIPFFVYLNEVTFHLYEKPKQVGASVEHFYGMRSMLDVKETINCSSEPFKVVVLTQDQLNSVLENAYGDIASRQIRFQKKAFREVHKKIFGTKPSEQLENYYVQMLIQHPAPEGEKYSLKTSAEVMYDVITTAYQIPKQ